MTVTQIGRALRIPAARGDAALASGSSTRGGRAGRQLWTFLHASALLNGTTGGPDDVAFIEDDRRRMAARKAR